MDNIFLVIIVIFVLFVIFNKQKQLVEKFDQVPSGFSNVVLSNINGDLQSMDYKSFLDKALPSGIIVAWSGSSPPDGWALCDGNNGRPDLRGRFILGWNPLNAPNSGRKTNELKGIGGTETVTLDINQIPSHTHQFYTRQYGGGDREDRGPNDGGRNGKMDTTTASGGGQPHDNMPPYYVLAYIIKV